MDTTEFIPYLTEYALTVIRRPEMRQLGQHGSLRAGHGQRVIKRRPYEPGDRPHSIDFLASNIRRELTVKLHQERRRMPVAVIVDCSRSMEFGTQRFTKKEKGLLGSASVAASARAQGDPVAIFSLGLRREEFFPPSYEDDALIRLQMLHERPGRPALLSSWTDDFLAFCDERHLIVLFSDFLDLSFWREALPAIAGWHDVVVCVVQDRVESLENGRWLMPRVGTLRCRTSDGREVLMPTTGEKARSEVKRHLSALQTQQHYICRRYGVDMVRCWDVSMLTQSLSALFALREDEVSFE